MTLTISKSQYLRGCQCPLALWYYRFRKDLMPDVPDKYVFKIGHAVGELAKTYFDNGIEITEDFTQIPESIVSTNKVIKDGAEVIYEATAAAQNGVYSRIDILKKVDGTKDTWDLIEVKASTQVKDYHYNDAALQRYAFLGAGYKIRKSMLMHLNKEYIKHGHIDVKGIFVLEDITDDVIAMQDETEQKIEELLGVLKTKKALVIKIGDHCNNPFACDFYEHC
ncbi:MAG: DUF2779 domain-containing protein, partial [Bacteroidota bacterium]